ncbi:response regulator [Pendulispora rubella]|uniref:Response regulator n=1 Tax=Pendulispora rubella TaxID=2741070 RepID=A0ABZ2L9M4_9BACT
MANILRSKRLDALAGTDDVSSLPTRLIIASTPHRASHARARPGLASRRCVLLVDDHRDTRALYAMSLKLAGFRVVEAAVGVQALERAFGEGPDIIVMDLWLPVLDGTTAMRVLRRDERTSHTPIIALTAHSGEEDRYAEFDVVLTKPCLPTTLSEHVYKIFAL